MLDRARRPQKPNPIGSRRGVGPCVGFAFSLLLSSGAQAQEAPGKPAPGEAQPGRQGEAFTYSLKLGPIEGGRARLAIAPPRREGKQRLIRAIGQAEAVGLAQMLLQLRDEYQVVLDADTLLPQSLEVLETGTLRSRTVRAEIAGRRADIHFTVNQAPRHIKGVLPAEPHDPVAAFLSLRAARLKDGDHLEMIVLDGAAFYRGTVEVIGRESIQTMDGPRTAIRLRCHGERINERGQLPHSQISREATLWMSDDRYRVPLRVESETDLGKAQFELTSYQPPRRPFVLPTELPGVLTRLRGR